MTDPVVARIHANLKKQLLKAKRSALGWWPAALMMVVYCG